MHFKFQPIAKYSELKIFAVNIVYPTDFNPIMMPFWHSPYAAPIERCIWCSANADSQTKILAPARYCATPISYEQ
jgi:hypothetical protein